MIEQKEAESSLIVLRHIHIYKQKLSHMLQHKVRNRGSESRQVITEQRQRLTRSHDHVCSSDSAERIHDQAAGRAFDAENLALAVFGTGERGACGAVVVEEAVQACSVDNHVVAVEDAQTKRVAVSCEAIFIHWIFEGWVDRVWTVGCIGDRLVVSKRRFC